MNKVEALIRETLAGNPDSANFENRNVVYNLARKAAVNNQLKKQPVDAARIDELVEEAINKVECEYLVDDLVLETSSVIGDASAEIQSLHSPDPILSENGAQFINENPRGEAHDAVSEPREQDSKKNGTPLVRSIKWLAFGLAGAIAIYAAYYLIGSKFSNFGPISVTLNYSNIDSQFSADATGALLATDQNAKFNFSSDNNKTTLIATGSGKLFAKNQIAVDTAKSYKVSVRLRVLSLVSKETSARAFVGLATYDKDGKLQTTRPGTHRYVALNQVLNSNDGWNTYSGIIQGVGNESHSQFRENTYSVRLVSLFNQKSFPNVQSELDWIKFEEQ